MAAGPPVEDVSTIEDFFRRLGEPDWSGVRRIRVADQGLVEPARSGSGWVMQPRVRVVATALDFNGGEGGRILRWQETHDTGSGVAPVDPGSQRRWNDPTGRRTRDWIVEICEQRGLEPVLGREWTEEDLEDRLAISR